MPWFKIKYVSGKVDYRYGHSEKEVLFDSVSKGHWQIIVSQWTPKKFDYKSLQTFYEEIQSALQSGLQLNQAIAHFALSSSNSGLANISKAILGELERGTTFNEALSKLTKNSAAPYTQLLNSQGTREDCEKSLSVSIHQLKSLLEWSQRLLKTLIYPFSVIQIALIILIINRSLEDQSTDDYLAHLILNLSIYVICSLVQISVIRSLHQGHACYWLEKYSRNFRLTKLFSLLSTIRKTGLTLQQALKNMPDYFQHIPTKHEIYSVYYTLRLGKNYEETFPSHWFPNESSIALHSAGQDGDIERALVLAAKEHEKRWQRNIAILEKLIPAICLMIAGSVVATALVTLYAPLIEI
ncbi:protein transport protein HofC/type IV pilus assembly protein PilC [Marinomonas alcarazii]|uniref:Protein transport protein HofC/type IV pilus assembly protein PilC n=1 Tax=Marinomonas alcarazii TaxID=491949 RepID=A0A318V8L8_9GAMM|nr:type II secretion system F family protein [Marinomonas alcarazii]PYF84924.1 protein transport protein HofC/type IV pilus assembly protein PilC [Marinomonas alcarazii]